MQLQKFTALLAAALTACSASALSVEDVSFPNAQGMRITGKLYRTHWSGARPAVVLLHGCAGVYSSSDPSRGIAALYTEWAERLTSAGYNALLVDSFTGRGAQQNQCGDGAGGVSEVGDRPHDAYAGLAYLQARKSKLSTDAQRIFLVGWSHGGSSALASMSDTMGNRKEGHFRAAFSFYPGCGLYNAFGGISSSTYVPYAPLTILHGGIDRLYTSGYCDTRVSRAIEAGASEPQGNPMRMIVYPGAKHSFDSARQPSGEWTAFDVSAKTSADAEVMNRLLTVTAPH